MGSVSRLFHFTLSALLICIVYSNAACARMPEKRTERSLLYWRYLCRNEEQVEGVRHMSHAKAGEPSDEREFKCVSQNWSVKTVAGSGVVKEILDDSP